MESSESEEPPAWKPPDLPPEAEVRKNKYKMRLKAILEALEKGEKEEEAVKKLKRYHKKASKRKKEETKDKEMSVNPEEILALLPNLSKEEKKTLLKELLREHEEEICRSLPSDLHRTQRPERRVRSEGYSSGPLPKSLAAPATPPRTSPSRASLQVLPQARVWPRHQEAAQIFQPQSGRRRWRSFDELYMKAVWIAVDGCARRKLRTYHKENKKSALMHMRI